MKVVQICKDGSMDDIDCKFTTKNICKVLTETSKSQGTNNIKLLYSWNYDKCTPGSLAGSVGNDITNEISSFSIDTRSKTSFEVADALWDKIAEGIE